jgi:hypothetical protein
MHGNPGGTDGGGRTSQDYVLPRAQARERDGRRHALLHEIIPHGWSRMGLYESHATMGNGYSENPEWALYRERFWRFLNEPSGIIGSLYLPIFKATANRLDFASAGAGLAGY